MNFLAHIALSYPHSDRMLGNILADLHTHTELQSYPEGVLKGVEMHQFIDGFTDSHEHFIKMRHYLRPHFDKWSPVILDVFHDYVLANNWSSFSNQDFNDFCESALDIISTQKTLIKQPAQGFIQSLVNIRWLHTYRTWDGISRALFRIEARTKGKMNAAPVVDFLQKEEKNLSLGFEAFYTDLQIASDNWVKNNI